LRAAAERVIVMRSGSTLSDTQAGTQEERDLDVVAELFGDVDAGEDALRQSNSQYNRRNYVRTAFAAVEGVLSSLREGLLAGASRRKFDAGTICVLQERSYGLDNKGLPVPTARFHRLEDTLLFLWKLYVKPLKTRALAIDTAARNWNQLKSAVQVRHRLTHPKVATDLTVSDAEMKTVISSIDWFIDLFLEASGVHTKRLNKRTDALRRRVKAREEDLLRLYRSLLVRPGSAKGPA